MVRTQLQEEFLRLYFPIAERDTDFLYTRLLSRESIQATAPPMTAAVDALCLLQLGTSNSDNDLLHCAMTRYNTAVASIRHDLGNAEAFTDDGLLAAIYVLGFCEMYGKSWTD